MKQLSAKKRGPQLASHQRRWFGKWHMYLGVFAGLILVVVGLTGSLLVFRDEIDAALNPQMFRVLEGQRKIPVGEILPMVQRKYPDLKVDYIDVEDESPVGTYQFFSFKTKTQVFINPYTGELAGKRLYESSFIRMVTAIHTTLLVPVVGRYIVGFAALGMLILIISGLRLWVPQKWKQLKRALAVDFKAKAKRQNYDWHNVLGLYSSPVVALIALTGFCMTFSVVVIPLLFILSGKSPKGVAQLLGAKSAYVKGAQRISVTEAMAIGASYFPDGKVAGIALPADSLGNYRLDIKCSGLPRSGKREMLVLDQYSGKVMTNSRRDFPDAGHAYLGWLGPIHYGSFGGLPTQVAALIGGLIPAALFVTGFIVWWPRYKKRKRRGNGVEGVAVRRQVVDAGSSAVVKDVVRVGRKAGYADESVVAEDTESLEEGGVLTDEEQDDSPVVERTGVGRYFGGQLMKGFRYAGWVLLIGAVMGALYGALSGIVLPTAAFMVLFVALLVVVNFVVALLVFVFNGLFLAPFRKGSRRVLRYVAWSCSFFVVFMLAWVLLRYSGLHLFS